MADFTERVSEVMVPLVVTEADDFFAGTYTSAYVSMANYHRGWLYLSVGEMTALSTLDVLLLEATSAAGAGAVAIAGKAITQLTQAGGDGDQHICIELRNEELQVTAGFSFVAVRHTVANANVELAYCFFGVLPRFQPGVATGWAEVVG